MLAETSGATIVYQNGGAALDDLVRGTIGPTYLPVLESALSELVPDDMSVRCNTREWLRVDVAGRFTIYKDAVEMQVLTAEDIRSIEGWPREGPIGESGLFAPVPEPPPVPSKEVIPA